ncbi:MAG: VPLPA-CTERM sorting domain-containing protein [Gammaproteobacteria bacterium]|jgi:hypothetical protein|nr:VPLPA-CTERM sorting domain-containing protein [Gammaproteobacteria bacterium]
MRKTTIALAVLAAAVGGNIGAVNAGTIGITGDGWNGTYSLTLLNGLNGALLGTSVTNPNNAWSFNFTSGSFSMDGGTLTTGFSYTPVSGALTDNGDGTYTASYAFGFGPAPAVATTTTWDITQIGSTITLTTLDTELDGINGTSFTNMFGTISPVMDGSAVSAVPVPAAAWLLASGLMGLVGVARKRKVRA